MGKVILICGKICAGKTRYAKKMAKDIKGVILSTDEIMLGLFGQYLGDMHDEIAEKTEIYLFKKAVEIIFSGINVILDWGFWTREKRQFATKYFNNSGIKVEWHYVEVDNENWRRNISKRNNAVINNKENFYFIDDNVVEKFMCLFEEPQPDEIDIWYKNDEENTEYKG